MTNFARALLVVSAALLVPAAALAQPQPPEPQNGAQGFLRARHEAVNRLLRRPARSPADEARVRAELTRALGDLLDYDELSRQALATHWGQRSDAERREFVGLLRQLVERNYQRNLRSTLEFDVRYLGEAAAPDGSVVVRTAARSRTQRRAPQIAIDYTLKRNGNGWRVYDITTDGVSLVRNYRAQFNRILQREGWGGLLGRMRSRLAEGSVL